jgi:hypothetical protein
MSAHDVDGCIGKSDKLACGIITNLMFNSLFKNINFKFRQSVFLNGAQKNSKIFAKRSIDANN